MVLTLIFAEVLGLYGLIVALIMNTRASDAVCFLTCTAASVYSYKVTSDLCRCFDEQFHRCCAESSWKVHCSAHTIQETILTILVNYNYNNLKYSN